LYDGTSATLKLDAPTAFTGAIGDLVLGDAIDLAGIIASSATYSGTTLTVNETNGQQLIYNNVSGSLAGDTVTVASDGNGGTDVNWIVGPPPVPTVVADTAHVSVAGTVTANAAHGVLANDTDPIPNGTLIMSAVDGLASDVGHAIVGSYGTLTLNADGSYSYVADQSVPSNIIAQDIFTYTATDGAGGSATSTLTITVTQAGQTYIAGTPGEALTSGNGSVFLDGSLLQNETISAGNGNDAVLAGSNDTISLGNGTDVVNAGNSDTISLGNGVDTVTAGTNSIITAGNGNDNVTAGSDSTIKLGNGSDAVAVGDSSTVTLGNGQDTVTAGANATIIGGNGNGNVTAGSDSAIKLGNGSDTVAVGDSSTVTLGNGNDTVFGGGKRYHHRRKRE
jgi:VCBS repeat-containing protein